MGVERRAPPNPLRVSSETADGRGSILIDTTAAQQTITAPAQTPGLHCNKTSSFSFLFHLPFSFSNPTHPHLVEWFFSLPLHRCRGTRPLPATPTCRGRSHATRRSAGLTVGISQTRRSRGSLGPTLSMRTKAREGPPKKSVNSPVRIPAASSACSPASRFRSRVAQPTQVGGAEEAAGGEGED